jgi:signal transduction histidine kinase
LKLDLAETDLVLLADQLVEMYSFVAEERGVTIRLAGPESLSAKVDPGRFRRVIGNLLDNAVKYSHDGGEVLVELSVKEGRPRIVVRDRGPGVPAEEVSRIWERLYRGAGSRTRPGLGIGLSIAKAVTEAHGGRIGVESEPGRGAAFFVELP